MAKCQEFCLLAGWLAGEEKEKENPPAYMRTHIPACVVCGEKGGRGGWASEYVECDRSVSRWSIWRVAFPHGRQGSLRPPVHQDQKRKERRGVLGGLFSPSSPSSITYVSRTAGYRGNQDIESAIFDTSVRIP